MRFSKLLQIYSIIAQKLYFHTEIYGHPKDCAKTKFLAKKG